jgi:hypothetical protein
MKEASVFQKCAIPRCHRPRTRRRHCEVHFIILAAQIINLIDTWHALEALN